MKNSNGKKDLSVDRDAKKMNLMTHLKLYVRNKNKQTKKTICEPRSSMTCLLKAFLIWFVGGE